MRDVNSSVLKHFYNTFTHFMLIIAPVFFFCIYKPIYWQSIKIHVHFCTRFEFIAFIAIMPWKQFLNGFYNIVGWFHSNFSAQILLFLLLKTFELIDLRQKHAHAHICTLNKKKLLQMELTKNQPTPTIWFVFVLNYSKYHAIFAIPCDIMPETQATAQLDNKWRWNNEYFQLKNYSTRKFLNCIISRVNPAANWIMRLHWNISQASSTFFAFIRTHCAMQHRSIQLCIFSPFTRAESYFSTEKFLCALN